MKMEWLSQNGWIWIVVAAAVVIVAIVIAVRNWRNKREQRIEQAFGKVPEPQSKYDMESIRAYAKYYEKNVHSGVRVDEITWSDLEMDRVFERVNACQSSVGEEYLYNALHEIEQNEKLEEIMQWMEQDPERRRGVQRILRSVGKRRDNGLAHFLFHAEQSKTAHPALFIILAIIPILAIISIFFVGWAGLAATVIAFGVNGFVYYFNRQLLEHKLEAIRYFSALLYGAKKLSKMDYDFELAEPLKPFLRIGGFISGGASQGVSELEVFTMFFKMVFHVDLIKYNFVVNVMVKHREALNRIFCIVGNTDAACSVLSFRKSLPQYCLPEFEEKNLIEFEGLYHPLLREAVGNDGCIRQGSIVTGSNASGKSTFIKAVAVNLILAQTISTCCGARFVMRHCYVASSMALRDDLVAGESYFITEIKSLKRLMSYCQETYCVCFVDEILRGTNTPERIAASVAVLRELKRSGGLCVVASHDIELTQILAQEYDNYHFCETVQEDKITFDYRLKDGPSTTTNAILLLEHLGFDERTTQEARRILQERKESGQ